MQDLVWSALEHTHIKVLQIENCLTSVSTCFPALAILPRGTPTAVTTTCTYIKSVTL